MADKKGASVIPFAINHGSVKFLFHKTFSGRRAGLLVDFGGSSRAGESYAQTAAREFVEETEAMYFAGHADAASVADFEPQCQWMLSLLERMQADYPDLQCRRIMKDGKGYRAWSAFVVEVPFKNLDTMNLAWAQDTSGRFRKRRELLWLPADHLLDIIDNHPQKLWKRIREYEGLRDAVVALQRRFN